MSRVLVTGAYGFLGRYVVRELLAHGYEVVAFGRKRDKLEALRADGAEAAELFVGDFCRQEDITAATKGVDFVIHAGALRLYGDQCARHAAGHSRLQTK